MKPDRTIQQDARVPEWLCEDGKEEWARVAGLPVVKDADRTMLAAYCQSYGRWREAERFLDEHGTTLIVRDDKGVVKSVGTAPQVQVSSRSLDKMTKLGRMLGLVDATPVRSAAPATGKAPRAEIDASQWFGDTPSDGLM